MNAETQAINAFLVGPLAPEPDESAHKRDDLPPDQESGAAADYIRGQIDFLDGGSTSVEHAMASAIELQERRVDQTVDLATGTAEGDDSLGGPTDHGSADPSSHDYKLHVATRSGVLKEANQIDVPASLPAGVVRARGIEGTVLEVPAAIVVSSRFRTRFPYAASYGDDEATRLRQGRYAPLPARWIDGHFEVLAREAEFDAIQALDIDPIRICPVHADDHEAVLFDAGSDKQQPKRCALEKARLVWRHFELASGAELWKAIADRMAVDKTTVSHYKLWGQLLSRQVMVLADVDEADALQIEKIRRLSEQKIRWAVDGTNEEARAVRIAILVHGRAPSWADPHLVEANTPQSAPAKPIRTSRRRDGTIAVIAEGYPASMTEDEIQKLGKGFTEALLAEKRKTTGRAHSDRSGPGILAGSVGPASATEEGGQARSALASILSGPRSR